MRMAGGTPDIKGYNTEDMNLRINSLEERIA